MKNNFFKNSLSAIDSLVERGIYNEQFTHSPFAQSFVREILCKLINNNTRRVLECGCGTGFWLRYISTMYPHLDLYGFDLNMKILIIAERVLKENKKIFLKEGDILSEASFVFSDIKEFDIIFCYDVIQQLSEKDYFIAIRNILSHLSAGGYSDYY